MQTVRAYLGAEAGNFAGQMPGLCVRILEQGKENGEKMSQYKEMDNAIIEAISQGNLPHWDRGCRRESDRLEELIGRSAYRIIDGRLSALKQSGKIRYLTKAKSETGKAGWVVVPQSEDKPEGAK